jgi:hypothetical protein
MREMSLALLLSSGDVAILSDIEDDLSRTDTVSPSSPSLISGPSAGGANGPTDSFSLLNFTLIVSISKRRVEFGGILFPEPLLP